MRYELKNPADESDERVVYLRPDQEKKQEFLKDQKTGQTLEVKDKMLLLEWLTENYSKHGCKLDFVTNKSQEGSQFERGFGGIGALLRFALDFDLLDMYDEEDMWEDDDDEE
jgi:peptide chain release factor subunit 1